MTRYKLGNATFHKLGGDGWAWEDCILREGQLKALGAVPIEEPQEIEKLEEIPDFVAGKDADLGDIYYALQIFNDNCIKIFNSMRKGER